MMKISVKVKPGSKQNSIEAGSCDGAYIVRVKEKAIEGKANAAVIAVLSDHFNVPKNRISIVRGFKGKNKLIDIETFS
jgi:uncharacterized protein